MSAKNVWYQIKAESSFVTLHASDGQADGRVDNDIDRQYRICNLHTLVRLKYDAMYVTDRQTDRQTDGLTKSLTSYFLLVININLSSISLTVSIQDVAQQS